jgi:hypothetical protein
MPNKLRRHKRSGTRSAATDRSKTRHRPDSVKDLLGRVTPALTRVSLLNERQRYWREFLTQSLPAQLCSHISGIVERAGTLVIFADSAAWCARLRYALQAMEPHIRAAQPAIQHIATRVLPRTADRPRD